VSQHTQYQIADWPLWWFSRLDAALERGDYRAAAEAQRELRRLGVEVRYHLRRPAEQGVALCQ
jgi:hypothetical protein